MKSIWWLIRFQMCERDYLWGFSCIVRLQKHQGRQDLDACLVYGWCSFQLWILTLQFFINTAPHFIRFSINFILFQDISPWCTTNEKRVSCLDRQRSFFGGVVWLVLGAGWHFACPTTLLTLDAVYGKWTIYVSLNLYFCSQFQNTLMMKALYKEKKKGRILPKGILMRETFILKMIKMSFHHQTSRRMMETGRWLMSMRTLK